jgi:RNA polymerase sigma-70 factor (ECF subfamily)
VFCRAYAGIERFRGEARLGTWLRSIAQHAIVDAARAAGLRQRLHEGNGTLESARENLHARDTPAPEVSTVRKDVPGKALQELHAMLGTQSVLFIRRHLEELSEDELAEAEGMRRGTVSGYLSRARKRLRQQHARFTALE